MHRSTGPMQCISVQTITGMIAQQGTNITSDILSRFYAFVGLRILFIKVLTLRLNSPRNPITHNRLLPLKLQPWPQRSLRSSFRLLRWCLVDNRCCRTVYTSLPRRHALRQFDSRSPPDSNLGCD